MATSKETPKNATTKNVGDYSEPGIHSGDEKNDAGQKKKFDRGDPDEEKTDAIQGEPTAKGKEKIDNPVEYAEPGVHSGDELDAAGHKKKFDRAAPEENPDALNKIYDQKPAITEDTEVSEPNYVAKEHVRQKEAIKQGVSGLSEKQFLENLVTKASAGGWNSPIIEEIKHRIETL